MNTPHAYAGFWNRFAAVFIDVLILLIPQALFGYLIGMAFVSRMASTDPVQNYLGFEIWSRGIGLGIAWLYFALLESSMYQATVGKMALGLVVTDLSGNPISFGRASGRFFGKLLSSVIFGVGYLMVGFTARKQALHDIMAKCLVIKKSRHTLATSTATPVDSQAVDDEQLYLVAQKEIDTNTIREGLWVKAFEQCPSDENLRRAAYLKFRVAQLRAEAIASLPPPVPIVQQFNSSAFGKWLRRDDVKILLIVGAVIGGIVILANYESISKWIRTVGSTTVVSDDSYYRVHASYILYGQERNAQNYMKISYRGGTIYFYNNKYSSEPDGIVRGAKGIIVWKGPRKNDTLK